MSRGHGAVQRHVLAAVTVDGRRGEYPAWLSVEWLARLPPLQRLPEAEVAEELADGLYPAATRARVESVRRACRQLEQEGLVETCLLRCEVKARYRADREWRWEFGEDRRDGWADRSMFHVRRTLTDDERQAERADRDRRERDRRPRLHQLLVSVDPAQSLDAGQHIAEARP